MMKSWSQVLLVIVVVAVVKGQFADNDFTYECLVLSANQKYCEDWTLEPKPGSCFSEDSWAITANGAKILVKDLVQGQKVLTLDPKTGETFETAFLDHLHLNSQAGGEFLDIAFSEANGVQNLEVTPDHLVYSRENGYILAGNLRVGDSMVVNGNSGARIEKISKVLKQGLYSPLTESGTLLVNSLFVTSYATITWFDTIEWFFLPYKMMKRYGLFREFTESRNKNGVLTYAYNIQVPKEWVWKMFGYN